MNSDNKNVDRKKEDQRLIYELDGRSRLHTAVPLGMQHILAMFTSNLAPILIIAGTCSLSGADTVLMMQCAMFVSGLTTFVQLYPIKIGKFQIGSRLPIVMGTSFAFVPTATTIAATGGLGAVLGGSLVGSTLIIIGMNLLKVGANYFAGGVGSTTFGSVQNLAVAFFVFIVIILLQRFGKGIVANSSILLVW
ncbi:solute carrier family 23 protein [Eubacterium aggregans]|uniref:solute carrier family 23 protein n=1 Tax=Eubacterium aggregans TaxID=81409 RepID=UPI003F321051